MKQGISLTAVGHATSLFLVITFVLCVAFDLAFPQHAMYEAWRKLLPGFEGISWQSFGLGLVECYGYGWYSGCHCTTFSPAVAMLVMGDARHDL